MDGQGGIGSCLKLWCWTGVGLLQESGSLFNLTHNPLRSSFLKTKYFAYFYLYLLQFTGTGNVVFSEGTLAASDLQQCHLKILRIKNCAVIPHFLSWKKREDNFTNSTVLQTDNHYLFLIVPCFSLIKLIIFMCGISKGELETMEKWLKSTFSSSKNDNIFHILIK